MTPHALVTAAIEAADSGSRAALEALWIGSRLRLGEGDAEALLAELPTKLVPLALGYVARAGRAPRPEQARVAQAWVLGQRRERDGGLLSDDEAALGLWAGLAPEAVGMGEVRPALRDLDGFALAQRMLTWGVPARLDDARAWIDRHLAGRARDAALATLVRARHESLGASARGLVEAIDEPILRFDAAVHAALGSDDAAVVELGLGAWERLEARARSHPALRGKRAALIAHASPDAARCELATLVAGRAAPLLWLGATEDLGPRWAAIAAARCGIDARRPGGAGLPAGIDVWVTFARACHESRASFSLGERREALLLDVLAAARFLPSPAAVREAVVGVFRDVLPRWRSPLWRALAWCQAIGLSAGAAAWTVAPMVSEVLALLREARNHPELPAHLPGLVTTLAPHAAGPLAERIASLPDVGLRVLSAMALHEALHPARHGAAHAIAE